MHKALKPRRRLAPDPARHTRATDSARVGGGSACECKGRGLCPSCGAKRAAEVAAFLSDEVVEDVGHAQWVFTVPKMLRVYFLHHRELLGELSRAGYETVKELMSAAVEEKGFRPGVVSMVRGLAGA